MTAREKFKVWDKVKLTERGVKHGLRFVLRQPGPLVYSETGVVRGFGREDYRVKVQVDGQKTASTFHMDFWEVIHPQSNLPS